ncbi:hypothetical protein [Kribbella antibiotica]|nr:hypothetical protein [Kribbella antibiotica]
MHRETLAALPADRRTAFVEALESLTDGQLAKPVDAQPVRRGRQRTG